MLKRSIQIFILIISSLIVINQATPACTCVATAQESTQITNKIQLIKQLEEQIMMVKNQFQMLEGLTGGMLSGISGANMQIMNQFMKVKDIWKQAGSLTHSMDDFIDKHNERHPEHLEDTEVNAAEERKRRDEEYTKMLDAYLEGLNLNAQDLQNSQQVRNQLMGVLQSTEGQVQAIQALGGLINHSSQLVEQNGQIASSYVTMFAENELDKRAREDNVEKNLEKAFDNAKSVQPSGKGFKPKSQW